MNEQTVESTSPVNNFPTLQAYVYMVESDTRPGKNDVFLYIPANRVKVQKGARSLAYHLLIQTDENWENTTFVGGDPQRIPVINEAAEIVDLLAGNFGTMHHVQVGEDLVYGLIFAGIELDKHLDYARRIQPDPERRMPGAVGPQRLKREAPDMLSSFDSALEAVVADAHTAYYADCTIPERTIESQHYVPTGSSEVQDSLSL